MWSDFVDEQRTRWWMRACDRVGLRAALRGRPVVRNLGRIEVGSEVSIDSVPVTSHLITGPRGLLQIGDHVSIAHGAAITSHCHVSIGEGTRIGPFVMVLDTDFHRAGVHSEAGEARPVRVGREVVIGARATLLRGARIGDQAVILSGSVVSGDIPAGATAGGVPARVGNDGSTIGGYEVPELVRRALGLVNLPRLDDGPHSLEGWTSLGALNVLLSLEEAFGVALRTQDVLGVRCVGDLVDVVERARSRPA